MANPFAVRSLMRPEWRESVLLFGGLLHKQGRVKVDAFAGRLLESVSPEEPLGADEYDRDYFSNQGADATASAML